MSVTNRPTPQPYAKVVSRSTAGHPDYICDGADDDVQIQAAITAVAAAGGGTIVIREGTYVLGAVVAISGDNIQIIGEGRGATILQTKAASTAYALLETTSTSSHCYFADFTLDGNKANQTTLNQDPFGLYDGDYHIVERVEVKNGNRNSGTTAGIWCSAFAARVINCYVHDNEYYGIVVDASGCKAIGCISESNGDAGIVADGEGVSVESCHSRLNTGKGIRLTTQCCIATNNTLQGNKKDPIDVAAAKCIVMGNYIDIANSSAGTSQLDADNTYSGILLSSASTDSCVITGNIIHNASFSGNNLEYAIREDNAGCDKNIITGNQATIGATGKVSTQGASTVSANNLES